ncbi:hypothetical protein [Marinobacter nauticus]|jgi:hypothetical protein|uniref:hypothetical protein n=1 Tax=Marinobacter nauticus TaxID=2743 RepID=UPI00241D9A3C|nr:hypothetical protein [Marinobacter nauticus]
MTITSTFIQKLKKQAKEQAKHSDFSHSQLLETYARELGYENWKDLLADQMITPPASAVLLPEFRDRLLDPEARRNFKQSMVMERAERLSACYAAFENINRAAKVVLVGLTPGEQQAVRANEAVAKQLSAGASDQEALKAAKVFASFSGPMRANLEALLDSIGLPEKVGIQSTSQLFGERSDLCHFTSALRYPVFVDDKNYSGSPSILKHPMLRRMIDDHLAKELKLIDGEAWYIPLGRESAKALGYLSAKGVIPKARILDGLPHPSGANAERIAYFLGRKERASLSGKTTPDALDQAKLKLMEHLRKDSVMDRNKAETVNNKDSQQVSSFTKQAVDGKQSTDKVMPTQIESRIIDSVRMSNMVALDGSPKRHELEVRFKGVGREESLYMNRKSYWRKDQLKITLRPGLSDSVSEEILRSGCATPIILKGEQREAYSSNFTAFNNKKDAKGAKNEHFGHAWLVDTGDDFSKLRQFLEILSTLK